MTTNLSPVAPYQDEPSPPQTVPSSSPAPPPPVSTPHSFYTFIAFPPGTQLPAQPQAQAAPQAPPVVTGIPPALAARVRHSGPWSANEIYSVAPTGPLSPVEEINPAPEWYMIARGRFVGVIDQYAMAHWAVRGVSSPIQKAYTSQVFALDAFNKVVSWGGVEVVRSNN